MISVEGGTIMTMDIKHDVFCITLLFYLEQPRNSGFEHEPSDRW